MRKLQIVILAVLMLLLIGVVNVKARDNALFAGGRYRSDSGFVTSIGFAKSLGSGFWNFTYADFNSSYKSLSTEFGYGVYVPGTKEKFVVGILAGPNSDWAITSDTLTYIDYLLGAGGFWVNWDMSKLTNGITNMATIGVWGYGKYKFNIDPNADNLIKKGWVLGLGLYYKF